MRRTPLLGTLLIVAVAVAAFVWWRQDRPASDGPVTSPAAATPAAGQPPADPQPTPRTATVPVPEPAREPVDGYIAFPDGTFLPPLNGVERAPRIVFHPRLVPFAKVVGIERDAQGRDWYVHENGVRSTTYLDATGKAIGDVMKPAEPKPMVDDVPGGR
ncbi:MAG: hypothetical protein IPM29_00515 [Planctomycetes bacterium]|nr:hypothetical protein [Planctomycetota bacterium]